MPRKGFGVFKNKMNDRNVIKGKPLNFNVGIQRWYVKELANLVDELTKDVYREIKPLQSLYY